VQAIRADWPQGLNEYSNIVVPQKAPGMQKAAKNISNMLFELVLLASTCHVYNIYNNENIITFL